MGRSDRSPYRLRLPPYRPLESTSQPHDELHALVVTLERHGPTLECVITLTEERALRQARQVDAEIARGRYRGPLHVIPWGGKDLLTVREYRTTWGAKPYEGQQILPARNRFRRPN